MYRKGHRHVILRTISIHHVDEDAVRQAHEGLFEYLRSVFVNEVDEGTTYPQEDIHDPTIFASFFFAADVIIAIAGTEDEDTTLEITTGVVDEPGTNAVKESYCDSHGRKVGIHHGKSNKMSEYEGA
ncbi:hypothetical protein V8B97DRAFT_2109924 [Scleroderma yunnanense]